MFLTPKYSHEHPPGKIEPKEPKESDIPITLGNHLDNNQLYYWAREAKNSNAEIDSLVVMEGKVYSVVFHSGPKGILENEKIVFLPLYFAGSFAKFGFQFS